MERDFTAVDTARKGLEADMRVLQKATEDAMNDQASHHDV